MTENFIFDSDDLITFCSDFDYTVAEDITESFLESNLQDLNERWSSLQKSYRALFTEFEDDLEKKFLEAARGKYSACTKEYHRCKSKILEMQKKVIADAPTKTRETSEVAENYAPINVPPCDTGIFCGGYEEWPSFRDMFTAVYIDNPRIPPVQKLYHLRLKVQGQAGSLIRKYKLCASNFSLAWDALRERYENQRILVENQIKLLLNLSPVTAECSESLQNLQCTINDCLASIKAQDVPIEDWDPFIIILCSSKLPRETLALWEQSLETHKTLVKWEKMDVFLTHRCEVVERLESRKKELQSFNQKKENNRKQQNFRSDNQHPCKVCNLIHPLKNCPQFLSLDPQSRSKVISNFGICTNCLAYSHSLKDCPSKFACVYCKKSHHSLLHFFKKQTPNSPPSDTDMVRPSTSAQAREKSLRTSSHMAFTENYTQTQKTLLPTAIVQIEHQKEIYNARAFFDQGSEKTFISKKLQQQLSLKTERKSFEICGMGGQVLSQSNALCNFTLYSQNFNKYIDVQAIVVPKITKMLPGFLPSKAEIDIASLKDFDLADPLFYRPGHVDLLIGSDILPQILLQGVKLITKSLLVQSTIFGWIISGPISCERISTFSIKTQEITSDPIGEQLRKFWEQEEIPNQFFTSKEDEFCEDLYQKTTFRNSEGRYVVKLPFKSNFPEEMTLGSSRPAAKAQLLQMERTLKKKPDFALAYHNVLEEYITLNHMETTVAYENVSPNGFQSFYLPHHAVLKPDSKTTKVRVVFNASNRSSSSLSLNDVLHVGPTLQNDLMKVILNWRLYKYVFSGDIEKMYRQILVHKEDTQFQRILFRTRPSDPVQDFALRTVTFGVNCAPYLAIRTLIQLAKDSKKKYPEAAYILTKEIYVDDILSGSHDLHSAVRSLAQLNFVLNSAGFPLKKLTSNCAQILDSVSKDDLLDTDFLKFNETSATKTLGIQWNALSDCFSYSIKATVSISSITKRHILSQVAKIFDPAGWISPIIIQAKIILQQIWLDGTGWDEGVKPSTLASWNRFVTNLPLISHIKIPRWVDFAPSTILQVHGFCDASQKAYCAAIYFRIESNTSVKSHLFVSKTKVAPINPVSLPRLELCGAVLLSQLVQQIRDIIPGRSFELFLWTDSSIVLGWLGKPPNTWKTYVANRTSQIIKNIGNASWRHVRSSDNPADLGSRGCDANNLIDDMLWWKGPNWLLKSPEEWPKPINIYDPVEEKKRIKIFHLITEDTDLLARFSNWSKAVRVMTFVWRFIIILRKRATSSTKKPQWISSQREVDPTPSAIETIKQIDAEEFGTTKIKLIILAQRNHYSEEYESLLRKTPIRKKSHLVPLNPYIDQDGIIRSNGRLSNSNIPFKERHPIIIPAKSYFCKLYIDFVHKLLMHAEVNLMLRVIRGEYFIPRLKPSIRFFIRRCVICTRYKQKVKSQIMGALPSERSSFSSPFTFTGLDFAGPFSIKTSLIRNAPYHKGYVCVFVCFCTKALHLELCSDLSTASFRAAFTRFVGRRGLPKKVMSDNGTNFVGAERAFRKEYEEFLKGVSQDIVEKYSSHNFQWSFVPPNAPHMGGIWEAGVKSFKTHFKKVAQNNKFTFEEFTTLLVRIESVLNSRPLSPMSDDPDELLALTPGHFLRGAPLISLPEPPSESLSLIDRWEKLKILHCQFAQRWKDEYLKEIQKRYKWQQCEESIKEGQLVVVKDDITPPNEWKLGRISKIYPGNDGLIRVADIRTQSGTITRALPKLCVLPVEQRHKNN